MAVEKWGKSEKPADKEKLRVSGEVSHKDIPKTQSENPAPKLAEFFSGDSDLLSRFDVMMNGMGLDYQEGDFAELSPEDAEVVRKSVSGYSEAAKNNNVEEMTLHKKELKQVWQKNFS